MIRLAVRVRREDAEIALAELLTLAPSGVEEVDLGDRVEVTTTHVADDWAERWKDFHQPIEVAGRLLVRAPWHPGPADDAGGLIDLVIDPGQAFGTGAHHTTRLCLELLLEVPADPPRAVMDVGCGSGVLAIAAAKLGFGPVAGVDHERESVAATLENARVNGVEVRAARHDLMHDGPVAGAPVVLANLLRPLLLRVAADGFTGTQPDVLIASGLLAHEADEVAAAFAAHHGLREAGRRQGGEWAALLLMR